MKFTSFMFLIGLSSCIVEDPVVNIDPVDTFDCNVFEIALTSEDAETLENILNPELARFTELDLDNDICPYTIRFDNFIEFIHSSCDQLDASLLCCVCLESFPTQSEMLISYESDGEIIERILNIVSPIEESDPLTFGGIY